METNHFNPFHTDINQIRQYLQTLLQQLQTTPSISPQQVEEIRVVATTLKSHAAIHHNAHMESYASQIEQLFQETQDLSSERFYTQIFPAIKRVERNFQQSSQYILNSQKKNDLNILSGPLPGLINQLHQMPEPDVSDRGTRQEKYSPQNKDEVNIEALFQGFIPWVQQASHGVKKEICVSIEVPAPVILPLKNIAPLQTILTHLLRNAVFHGIEFPSSRKRHGKAGVGTIQLSALVDENFLIITVSDDGQGISEQQALTNDFTALPFMLTQDSQSSDNTAVETSIYATHNTQTGLGIGLYIVKRHVEMLRGEFELKSTFQQGTSAIIRLPIGDASDTQGEEE